MKLKIRKNVLSEALNNVSKALSSKNIVPILSGIKFNLTKEKLILTASDNDITIQYQRISLFPDNLKYIFDILLLIFISAEHGIKIRPIPVFIILSHQIDHPGTQIPAIK